jgi:hypothetical protein
MKMDKSKLFPLRHHLPPQRKGTGSVGILVPKSGTGLFCRSCEGVQGVQGGML